MMIQSLGMRETAGMDLAPAAAIAVSAVEFRDRGVAFEADHDDLDSYELAAFTDKTAGVFALLHYVNGQTGETTLLLPSGSRPTAPLIVAIAAALGIPPSAFSWRAGGELVRAEPAAHAAD